MYFDNEIKYIKQNIVKDVTLKALSKVSDKFYADGASSTGKYHPDYAAGDGGLARHVKSATNFAIMLLSISDFYPSKNAEYNHDIIIAAIMLHDSCKKGVDFSSKYTDFLHPLLVSNLLSNDELTEDEQKVWKDINELISTHMGQWNVDKYHPEKILPKAKTKQQEFVHFCDYLASRKQINVTDFGVSLNTPEYYEKLEEISEYSDVLKCFENELSSISDDKIKNLVVNALNNSSPKFLTECTSKFYPAAYTGKGGLVRYVKTTCYLANLYLNLEGNFYCDHDKDIVRAALILHRCADKGIAWNSNGYLHESPMLVRTLINENQLDGEYFVLWDEICSCIETCRGKWNTNKASSTVLPIPTNENQLLVHWCNYLATRNNLEINIFIKDEEKEKEKKKFEPATEKQIAAINRITVRLEGEHVPISDDLKVNTAHLSKGQAGKVISQLKALESNIAE